jgi:phospholipid/cholesterol/gamma-HCH transport system substrate-binding protein
MTDDDLPQVPPSRSRDQMLWVGLFIIVGIVATLGVLFTMTDAALFRGRYVLETHVSNAGGIRRGDPVQMRGVNIGRILGFTIGQEGVDVRLEIEGEYAVPADSRVQLKSAGLLQGMVADITPGVSTQRLRYGDKIAGTTEEAVVTAAERLVDSAGNAIARVDRLLSEEMIKDVHGSGAELRSALKALSATITEQRRELRVIEASMRKNTESLERVTGAPELERSVKRLDEITARADRVAASLERTSRSAEDLLGRLERGEGTVGKLTRDDALYREMNGAAQSIKQAGSDVSKLVSDIRKDPKKYLKFSVF